MARAVVPKNCMIHSLEMQGRNGVEVRYRCKRGGSSLYETGSEWYPDGKGGGSNYPHKLLRGIRSIRLPGGISVRGSVAGFMKCTRSGSELSCKPL